MRQAPENIRPLILAMALLVSSAAFMAAQDFEEHEIPLPPEAQGASALRLFCDHQGFIWLAADRALFRYEGRDYKKQAWAEGAATRQAITAMYRDSSGVLWAGDASGKLYREAQGALRTSGRFPDSSAVSEITQGPDGVLWATSKGGGLAFRDREAAWTFPAQQPAGLASVYRLVAQDGKLQAATDYGLYQLRRHGDSLLVENHVQPRPDQIVKWIDTNGQRPLLGFYEALLQRGLYGGDTLTAPSADAAKVLQTHNLTWWLSERGKLYHAFGNTPFRRTQVGLKKSVPTQDMTLDREGHLWVSTRNGLYRINLWLTRYQQGKSISALHLGDSLLYQASEGVIEAIHRRSGRTEQLFTLPHRVLSLWRQAGAGFLWAGTFNGGLYRWDIRKRQLENFTEADGLINNNVLSLAGNQERLWIGTLGGVGYLPLHEKAVRFKSASTRAGASLQYVYKIEMNARGQPLIATDGQGILRWEGQHFVPLRDQPSAPVIDLAIDQKERVWALTREGALRGFGAAGTALELPPSEIQGQGAGLQVGPQGGIYMFRDGQVSCYLPGQRSWRHYGSAYGLGQLLPQLHAQQVTASGAILCGTEQGIMVIQPAMLEAVPRPKTFLQGVELYLQPTGQQAFAADQNHLTFHYLGRWYIRPEAVRYRVMLEGYDLDWSISKNTQVTYPRLPPGDYTFKVIAGVNGRFPSDQMRQYAFTIAAPWYQRWYGMGGLILVGLGSMGGVVRWQLRRNARRQKQEKERVRAQYEALRSQVNPHFLFNSFNTLMALIEEDTQLASQYLEGLSDFFRRILHYRDTDLISLEEELQMVGSFLHLQHIRFDEALEVNIQVRPEALPTAIPPLTLQLLVENALKHNQIALQKPLRIEIFTQEDELIVRNPLQPKATQPPSTGYGLDAIARKYRYYSKRPVRTSPGPPHFIVSLPLLAPLSTHSQPLNAHV